MSVSQWGVVAIRDSFDNAKRFAGLVSSEEAFGRRWVRVAQPARARSNRWVDGTQPECTRLIPVERVEMVIYVDQEVATANGDDAPPPPGWRLPEPPPWPDMPRGTRVRLSTDDRRKNGLFILVEDTPGGPYDGNCRRSFTARHLLGEASGTTSTLVQEILDEVLAVYDRFGDEVWPRSRPGAIAALRRAVLDELCDGPPPPPPEPMEPAPVIDDVSFVLEPPLPELRALVEVATGADLDNAAKTGGLPSRAGGIIVGEDVAWLETDDAYRVRLLALIDERLAPPLPPAGSDDDIPF